MYENNPEEVVQMLIKNKKKLSGLEALFFADVPQEESEISWIELCDLTELLESFPQLKYFRIQGSNGLELKPTTHRNLEEFCIECGGLGKDVIHNVLQSDWPNLRHLELYLGTEEYGANYDVSDFNDLWTKDLFPRLEYLGLSDCYIINKLVPPLMAAPIMRRISTLDLSKGTMTDTGAKYLLGLAKYPNIKTLDLSHHYITNAVLELLEDIPGLTVDDSESKLDEMDPDDVDSENEPYRYVAVGE